ncbi:hypothetical protein ACFOWA_08260 [Pedobacter lithocola]|uniref:Uncharacterized protein n=1 Tax=Pedobacter lithocola TaxID=1908239 RepID=A0ABV8PAA1_9SPHI
MKTQETLNPSKLRITIMLIITAVILSIPLVAMQFTTEVNWTLLDFVAAGVLLLSTCLAIEIVIRNVQNSNFRAVLFFIILMALFLIWAELAVGIFGTPFAGS